MGEVLRNTLMITGFVFVMMLVIEYVNVLTSGVWRSRISGSRFGQYFIAAMLGVIPGCLGSFAVVAMYSHRIISIGAVVTAMVATSGDEAFVMLAMIPKQTFILMAVLFVVGIVAGMVTDLISGTHRKAAEDECCGGLVIHEGQAGAYFLKGNVIEQLKHCTAARGVLAIVIAGLVIGVASGEIGGHHHEAPAQVEINSGAGPQEQHLTGSETDTREHPDAGRGHSALSFSNEQGEHIHEWGWIRITMLLSSIAALIIVLTVSDHFLEEHLWEHIAKKHLIRIFLWTFGALFVLYFLTERLNIDLEAIASQRVWAVLVIAALVGLIPESGPHLVFVTMFAQGIIPFSVLVASSIVQDGHGMLPMLAHSRRDFAVVKVINLVAGLALGAALLLSGH